MTHLLLTCITFLNLFCADNPVEKTFFSLRTRNPASFSDSIYMRTGFYFLAGEETGVKMKMESSGEDFYILKTPFASVDNVVGTEIQKHKSPDGHINSLCMKFDDKGTKDLEANTGNPVHPKVAVIITNKLLYVFDNNAKIKTGVTCVILENLSEQEMIAMKKKVDEKN